MRGDPDHAPGARYDSPSRLNQISGDEGQRMSVYQAAPGSADEDALKLLAMLAAEPQASHPQRSRSVPRDPP